MFLPSGVNASTSARFSSPPHSAPSAWLFSKARICIGDLPAIPSASLVCEPTETNMRLPSGENATSRRMAAARPEATDQSLGRAARGEIAVAIGETKNAVADRDIDELRLRTGRIKRDAERAGEAARERFDLGRFRAVIRGADRADLAGIRFGDENIAVRRDADEAR